MPLIFATGPQAQAAPVLRVAVIIPHRDHDSILRLGAAVAQALQRGSALAGEAAQIVLGFPASDYTEAPQLLQSVIETLPCRSFLWRQLDQPVAAAALLYAHNAAQDMPGPVLCPDDGIAQFYDCDLWVVIGDRLPRPLLPLRPTIVIVADYPQRYDFTRSVAEDLSFLQTLRQATQVWALTEQTLHDTMQFAGVGPGRARQMPPPVFAGGGGAAPVAVADSMPGFIWGHAAAPWQGTPNLWRALRLYYMRYGGSLACRIVPPCADMVRGTIVPDEDIFDTTVTIMNGCGGSDYAAHMAQSAFLLLDAPVGEALPYLADAARLGLPVLGNDYPALRELAASHGASVTWLRTGPEVVAQQLKAMERTDAERLSGGTGREGWQDAVALRYWEAVRTWQ